MAPYLVFGDDETFYTAPSPTASPYFCIITSDAQEGKSAAAWQAALGLSQEPAAGTMVFLRGPGTTPRVLAVPQGKTGDLPEMIDQQGRQGTFRAQQALP